MVAPGGKYAVVLDEISKLSQSSPWVPQSIQPTLTRPSCNKNNKKKNTNQHQTQNHGRVFFNFRFRNAFENPKTSNYIQHLENGRKPRCNSLVNTHSHLIKFFKNFMLFQ